MGEVILNLAVTARALHVSLSLANRVLRSNPTTLTAKMQA
jgi:hypothetical protein